MRTNDPIGRMFERGQLRRATDRDGKAAEARLKAARRWQSIYADLPGAQLSPDKRKAAQAMSRLEDQLGEYRSLLLRRVLGEKLELVRRCVSDAGYCLERAIHVGHEQLYILLKRCRWDQAPINVLANFTNWTRFFRFSGRLIATSA